MNSYTPHTFGVKVKDNYVAVEVASLFGDISKYDFMLKDSLVDSYNGNNSFQIEVMTEIGKDAIINGWKLSKIRFPGNWYGQTSLFVLTDKYDCAFDSKKSSTQQLWYDKQPEVMIRETLLDVLRFTQEYFSVKHYNVVAGFEPPTQKLSLVDFYRYIQKIDSYIKDYQEALVQLETENVSKEVKDHLKLCFDNQIIKCFSFSIDINK